MINYYSHENAKVIFFFLQSRCLNPELNLWASHKENFTNKKIVIIKHECNEKKRKRSFNLSIWINKSYEHFFVYKNKARKTKVQKRSLKKKIRKLSGSDEIFIYCVWENKEYELNIIIFWRYESLMWVECNKTTKFLLLLLHIMSYMCSATFFSFKYEKNNVVHNMMKYLIRSREYNTIFIYLWWRNKKKSFSVWLYNIINFIK